MPAITVIMPSLNVARYIRTCMESVLTQTLRDLEIIAIDAGSNDGTREILEEYAALDERVRVIHSDQKSYGYQLNLGIEMAKGDYVGVVETDDKILPNMYETLYHTALKTEAEYVKGRAALFLEMQGGAEWDEPIRSPIANRDLLGKVITPRDMPELLIRDLYLWTGIYKKEYICHVRLNETPGAAFQDQGFLFQTISSAKKAVYLDEVVYLYRQDNANSSIHNQKGFHYLVEEYAYVEKFLADKDKRWKNVYYQRMLNQCLGRFRTMAASGVFWEEAFPEIEILRRKLQKAEQSKLLKIADLDAGKKKLLHLFCGDAKELYSYYLNEFQRQIRLFHNIVQAVDHRQVVIFGGGKIGRFFHVLAQIRQPGLVVAFCDNRSELWDTVLQGIPVLNPEKAVERYLNAYYVVANARNADDIERQLVNLGVVPKDIGVFQIAVNLLLLIIEQVEEYK